MVEMTQRRGLRSRRGAHRPAESASAWATILSWAIVAAVFLAVCSAGLWLLSLTKPNASSSSQTRVETETSQVSDVPTSAPTEAPTVSTPSPSASDSFTSPSVRKSRYKVTVLNGSGAAGQAGAVRDLLKDDGWTVKKVGNTKKSSLTIIRYPKLAAKDAALAVQADLKAGTLEQDSSVSGIVIIIGADYL